LGNVVLSCGAPATDSLGYQYEDFSMKTLQEALVVYKTYAKAEGKSPKTITWVVSSVNYFSDFLGPTGNLLLKSMATIYDGSLFR
jgi:hypothetical protein